MDTEKAPPIHSEDWPKSGVDRISAREEGTEAESEARLSRSLDHKFDIRIVPWIFGIWLFAFIDRSNIGNAKIVGLPEDLGIAEGNSFNVALLVFYIPYLLVDVPSNWIVKHVKAGIYLPALITGWGLVCTFLGFTRSLAGLIVARLLLGLFEGGLLGGIVVYLAMFYRRHQMLRRVGYFYSAAPLSGAFGGLLATGLSKIRHGGYNRWPWIFFVEGAVTALFGILCFFFMPHTPADAKFLTEEERALAMSRMRLDSHGATIEEDVNQEKFDWHWVRMAFVAPQLWFSSLIWFFLLIPVYSFSLFLPTIISGLGYKATEAQLFTVPPNLAAFVVVLLVTRLSDRLKARGPLMVVCCLIAIIGYILLLATHKSSARYAGTFLVAIGIYPNSALIMGWLSNNMAPHFVRATGIGFLIAFANTSAFISTFIYLPHQAPNYVLGHSISLGALVICAALVCLQVLYLSLENKKRARGDRDDRLVQGEEHRLGHRHPAFVYTI
ncbi:MFS transporter-like protein [Xylaria sp. CBS 124048]|nr:MFS transporter-like protein [Xylaria sp. CBS 124048]